MQSEPVKWTTYVRPPEELNEERGKIWQLLEMPYGILKTGKQWAVAIEDWFSNKTGFETVQGISQIFLKRDQLEEIRVIIMKVANDILMEESVEDMKCFC